MANVPTSQLLAEQILEGTINITGTGEKYSSYTGEYVVTPRITEQILPTAKKSMEQDLTVEAINYLEVSNPEGGKTVTIGFE